MNLPQAWTFEFIASVLKHAILPALSLILIGVGSWFLGMRSLVSNIVTEDYVVYAELAGVESRRILSSYVMRNALVPQVTGLAISLGGIFNGAVITEKVFGYPGVGSLLVDAVYAGDYGLVLGVTTISILGVSIGVLAIDSALSAARSEGEGELMLAILRDLLRYNAEFRIGVALVGLVLVLSLLREFLALSAAGRLCGAAGRAAIADLLVRHHLARPGCVLATDFRHSQHLAVRLHRGADQPPPGARDRACQRLQGRLDRPCADVRERHLHRDSAASDPGAVLFRDARQHVVADAGADHGLPRLGL